MVEAIYSVIPSLPSVPDYVQSYAVAAIVFAMVFCPLWRFGKSLCDGIDRVNAGKEAKPLGRTIGGHNRPGIN